MGTPNTISPSSIARIAGNIASGLMHFGINDEGLEYIARISVHLARLIADEIEQPFTPTDEPQETAERKD